MISQKRACRPAWNLGGMSNYGGSAVVLADGSEYRVQAYLRSQTEHIEGVRGLSSWDGTLETSGEEAAWSIDQAAIRVLRTEDGREGSFITVGGDLGAGTLLIRGSGKAPFGD